MFYIAPVLLSLCVVQFVMAAVLMTFWRIRVNAPGLPEMASAMAVSSLGALLMGIGTSSADFYFAYVGFQCFIVAILLAARAMRRLQGLAPLRVMEAVAFTICAIGDAYFLFFASNFSSIAVLHSATYAIIGTVTARALFREQRAAQTSGGRIPAVMFSAFAVVSLTRVIVRLFFDMPTPVNMHGASLGLAYALFGIAISIGWTLGFVWTSYSVAEYRLRAANDKLKRFSGAVAHDLNTPLIAVIGYLDAVRYLPADAAERRADYISTAREAALRMNSFIHDLLEQSRDGNEGRAPEIVDTAACIETALKSLQPRIDATGATVRIDANYSVMATPFQMTRVFLNLLDNAIKYRTEQHPLEIHISSVENDDWVSITVQDNGRGIPNADQHRIFEQFERAEDTGGIPGYGVGLAECRNIIESFGGTISVKSKPGNGSSFTLKLPAAAPEIRT